jgi:hypothetical protein
MMQTYIHIKENISPHMAFDLDIHAFLAPDDSLTYPFKTLASYFWVITADTIFTKMASYSSSFAEITETIFSSFISDLQLKNKPNSNDCLIRNPETCSNMIQHTPSHQ